MSLLDVKDLCRTFRQGDTEIHAVDHVFFCGTWLAESTVA